jgi:YD repeat-containing protein
VTEFAANGVNLVTGITLPDGSAYSFQYESTPGFSGYKTGRLTQVTLPTGGTINYTYTGGSSGHITCADGSAATVTRVTPDGTWTYAQVKNTGAATTTITDPQSNVTIVNFQGIYETKRVINQGASTALRTVTTCYNGTPLPCSSASTTTAITLPITIRSVLDQYGSSGSYCKHDYFYNSYGLPTMRDDYDYPSGSTMLRRQVISYASLGNGIVSMPQTVTVCSPTGSASACNGTGTVVGQTTITYDGSAVSASGATQLAAVSGSRGNPTTVASLVQGPTTLSQTLTYFDTGNVNTATDANGAVTSFSYAGSSCNSAFPTSVSEPLSLSRSFAWNCTGGVLTSVTDENGHPTTTTYSDPYFWRPDHQDLADGGRTSWAYNSPTSLTTTTKMNASQNVVSTSLLDTLGRPSQNQLTSDPQGTDYTITTYDSLGRPQYTYNPTRCIPPTTKCGSEPTWGKTTYAYDALSRPTTVTDPDNSASTASYSNNSVTVTDEAGKKRALQYDALGRPSQVTEDPSGLAYVTTYGHDVLGNLTNVTQGALSRTYAYDGLSRLTSETNPETGSTAITYQYDTNGDLHTRIDARVTITYAHDALHRLTSKSYSDGTTPQIIYGYDITNPFSLTATNTAGRLVQIWTGASSPANYNTWTAFSYDAVGRVTTQWNCFSFPWNAVCPNIVSTGMQYDVAGNLIQTVYPSGLAVQQSFDSAGRVCQIAAATSSCASATNPWASSFTYSPASQVTGFTYGNSVAATYGYSSRLQTSSIKYTKGASTLFSSTYSFGSAAADNGSIAGITDLVDNGRSSAYTHDALNRLHTASTTGSTNYPAWGLQWTYDKYGNATQQAVTAGSAPSFPSLTITNNKITNSPYAYDSVGNMTNDGNNTLVYDGENRITSATNGGSSGAYAYGGDNLRVHQLVGASARNSIYLGSNLLSQPDNQSGVLNEYIFAGGQPIASIGGTSVSNGSFESGLTGWTAQGSTVQVITDVTKSHSGNNYIKISTSSAPASVNSPSFAVLPGDQVDFGGWVYLESGTGAVVDWVLGAQDTSHTLVAAVVPTPWNVTSSGSWVYETGSYRVPAGVAYVYLYGQIYGPTGATVARFDDGFLAAGTRYLHPDHLSTRLLTDASGNTIGQQGHYPFGGSWYAQNLRVQLRSQSKPDSSPK